MKKPSTIIVLFAILLILGISGCATQTKHFIPDDIPEIKNGMSRIVLTRESQLAGAGSPMIILDIGENIKPNGMVYFKDIKVEDILKKENFASIAGIPNDRIWFWFNPELVTAKYCSDNGPGCIKYHWRWPKSDHGGLLYGTVINIRDIGDKCIVDFGYSLDSHLFDLIRKEELTPVKISGLSTCKEYSYTGKERVKSLIPIIDKLIVKDYFRDFFQGKLQGYNAPGLEGYFLLVNIVTNIEAYQYLSFSEYGDSPKAVESVDYEKFSRNIQVVGTTQSGDTLIWDRKPGIMRLGSAWWDGLGFMPKNIQIEAGKTYFIHYTIRFNGQRWELMTVEQSRPSPPF